MDLFLSTEANSRLVARVEALPGLSPSDVVPLALDPAQLHWFRADETGASLGGSR